MAEPFVASFRVVGDVRWPSTSERRAFRQDRAGSRDTLWSLDSHRDLYLPSYIVVVVVVIAHTRVR
jgi:hypothetical protein